AALGTWPRFCSTTHDPPCARRHPASRGFCDAPQPGSETLEGRARPAQHGLVAQPLDVVTDDLGLVPATVAVRLEGLEDLQQRQDAAAEKRPVHGSHGRALVIRDLNRVDAVRGIATNRVEQATFPAGVPDVEHVAAAAAGAAGDLAGIAER